VPIIDGGLRIEDFIVMGRAIKNIIVAARSAIFY